MTMEPTHELVVDVEATTASYRGKVYRVTLPAGTRTQLLEGTWDATRILLQAEEEVRQTAARLPYARNFRR